MASVDGQEYASPSKRIKLDLTDHLANSNVELDFGTHSTPTTMVHESVEEPCSSSSKLVLSASNEINFSIPSGNVPDTSLPSCSSSNKFNLDNSDKSRQDKDDERDEVSSTVSNLSDLSGLSDISGQEWKPMAGPMCWVQKQMMLGANPRSLLGKLLGEGGSIPAEMDELTLWKIIVNIMTEPPRRPKLKHVNTLADVVGLLRTARKIIVLTGAGVSVSCGIPDFRSRGGIYSRLALDFPDLPDPQSMFDIGYFRRDPRPFFKFAREIYPGQFSPSPCHRFIRALERQRRLLRNYSQNIDTLEQVAGIENVIECHGSFATASCTNCKHRVSADDIRADIFAQRIPLCPRCHDQTTSTNSFDMSREYYKELVARGVMKPDIVFFGEGLPDSFHDSVAADKDQVDLMIVIGSTLKVRPVALIPSSIPVTVPQILINREPLPHLSFDVELLGDSDVIINQLCHMLGPGWEEVSALAPLHEACRLRPQHPWEDSLDAASASASAPDESAKVDVASDESGCVSPDETPPPPPLPPLPAKTELEQAANAAASKDLSHPYGVGPSAMSVDNGIELCNPKERHMSIDSSTRDSGLCADSPEAAECGGGGGGVGRRADRMSVDSDGGGRRMSVDSAIDDGANDITRQRKLAGGARGGGWAGKVKESLAARLPDRSFYRVPPSRYIFPGAEVFCETAESDQSLSDSGSDDATDDDSDDDSDGGSGNASFWTERPPPAATTAPAGTSPVVTSPAPATAPPIGP